MITSCVVGTRKNERETHISEKVESARVRAHLARRCLTPDNLVSSGKVIVEV